jgi:cytochrome bd-type quinol oxidase subunit 2
MTTAIALAAIIILPIAILVTLRVNATLVFLSLCLGNVLTQFVATNTSSLTNLLYSSHINVLLNSPNNNWKLVLLLLPVVITTALMFRTVKGHSRKLLNVLPAAAVGLVGALLVVPLLPSSTAQGLVNNSLWNQLTNYQAVIVSISALVCLSMLVLQRPKGGKGKHGKHSAS